MTRDEIRGLMGAYATGSLSADERKALFEAALEDQQLFDELAREQALKELLDEPGVKERLVASLASRQKPWWTSAWVWAVAGAFAIAVIAGVVLFRMPPPQEVARVIVPATPVPPPVAPPVIVPKQAAPIVPTPAAKTPAEAQLPPPTPPPVALTEQAPVLPPTPQATASVGTLGTGAAPAGPGGGGGRGGGRGGAGAAARTILQSPAATLARFAFDYSVTTEGALRIAPAANGFLTVGASNGNILAVLFYNRPLQAGSITEVPLPADSVSAVAIFSAREIPAGLLNIPSPTDPPSGTKSDPNPTPDSRVTAVIPVKR